ncbi:DC-STAMP domain-containing protein 2 isoform X3 [Labrus mixtus]|uniref:DC-STAMP domain-containing protein 2 isoform X3 n=1 Tax=Labrus mixtus TaxID=508554 RepID=UPI0029BFD2A7|nr:DC-STAMP domain-containing protein 2 isoform X3 [Labrus mixtus]
MRSEHRQKHLMKCDVRVQIERGGVTQAVRGVLNRSTGRSDSRIKWKTIKPHLQKEGRSLAAFFCGLLLASVYGLTALFLQKQPLWFCVYTTIAMAALAAFGLGLSAGVRADVTVMLPSLCSGHGRSFLLFLFVSALLSGPLTNTLENTERAAASLLCGAELAANQTQELMQRSATPLFSALDKIREISSNAHAVAGRVQNFIHTLTDSVRHVAGELFCTIPSYIAGHLKKRLAAPTVAAFQRLKREFDFNISASVKFDLDANSSRSLQQVSRDIMEEVSSELHLFQTLSAPLTYGGLVLLACSYLRAVRYRRRYLSDLDFDNVYISAQFEELDRQLTSGGGASVLPITRLEAKTYITPLSFHLSGREWRAVLAGVVSVLRHLVMGGLLVALDFLVFWMLDQVQNQVKGDVVARAPVTVAVQVNGSGYASDIFKDLVTSFNILQGGNITVISRKCLLAPSEPDYSTCFTLGFLLGLSLLVSLSRGFMQRCRRLACASYHPHREQERIRFLRQQILDQRWTLGNVLRRSAARIRADGGGGGSHLQALLLRLPGGVHLSHLLGLSLVTCLACGEEVRQDEDNMAACDVPQCAGVFCRPCFHSLGNTCVACERPLTSQEDGEEELDSSDDEQLDSTHRATRRGRGAVSMATRPRPRESDTGVSPDSKLSEADMTYQDRPGSDDSEPDTTQDETLHRVITHT